MAHCIGNDELFDTAISLDKVVDQFKEHPSIAKVKQYMNSDHTDESFSFHRRTQDTLLDKLKQIKSNKAGGPNGQPPRLTVKPVLKTT